MENNKKDNKNIFVITRYIMTFLIISLVGVSFSQKVYGLDCPSGQQIKSTTSGSYCATFIKTEDGYDSSDEALAACRTNTPGVTIATHICETVADKGLFKTTYKYNLYKKESDITNGDNSSSTNECNSKTYNNYVCADGSNVLDVDGKCACVDQSTPRLKTTTTYRCDTAQCLEYRNECTSSGGTWTLKADEEGECGSCPAGKKLSSDKTKCVSESTETPTCNGTNDPSDKDKDGFGWADKNVAKQKGDEDCGAQGKVAYYHDWGEDGCYNYYCRTGGGGGNDTPNPSYDPTPINPSSAYNPPSNNNNSNNNPQTGSALIYTVWIIGVLMIGYSIWYFKGSAKNSN